MASPEGACIVICDRFTCSIKGVESGEKFAELHSKETVYVVYLIFLGDLLLRVLGFGDPSIRDIATRRVCTLSSDIEVERFKLSPDSQTVVTARCGRGFETSAYVWDGNSCQPLHVLRSGGRRDAVDVAFFDGGATLAYLWGAQASHRHRLEGA